MFNKVVISFCIILATIIGYTLLWSISADMISSKNTVENIAGISILIIGLAVMLIIINSVAKSAISTYRKLQIKKEDKENAENI